MIFLEFWFVVFTDEVIKLILLEIFHFYYGSLVTISHVLAQVFKMTHESTKFALGLWIVTEHGIMSYLITFCDFLAATFTYDSHEIAIVQLMCTQNKFFISELIATL